MTRLIEYTTMECKVYTTDYADNEGFDVVLQHLERTVEIRESGV
jgi:hypothetical protein